MTTSSSGHWLSKALFWTTKQQDGPVAIDPLLYYVSPLQLWLGKLVSAVNKTGIMENEWLPVFSKASAHLRLVFAKIRSEHGAKAAFIFQWETGGMLLLGVTLELIYSVASVSAPLLLRLLLLDTHSATLAWLLVGANIVATLAGRAKNQVVRTQSTWVEVMLRTAIFEKSLRLSPAARRVHPPAQIINMSAVDVDFLSAYVLKIHDIWVAPLQITAIVVLAASIIGPAALVGFLLLLIMFFSQSMASQITRGAVVKYVHLNDQRLGPLRELLNNIKSVKAAAYEFLFRDRVSRVRNEQLKALWVYLSMAFWLFSAINVSIPSFTAAAAFLFYYLTGHELTAAVVFPALAYFNLLGQPVFFATLAVTRQAAILPSFKRVRTLMAAEESDPIAQSSLVSDADAAVEFEKASFTYASFSDDHSDGQKLEVGDLVLPRNKLTAVIGPTGSGKSSLLQAILGEMALDGSIRIHGSLAYVAQDPWIMSGTLRDNIVFMSKLDQARYQEVVRQCCLDDDFRSFPGGDQFVVGEAGNNLSGGQRARIALARALYSQPQILLLDDPLSAVDGRVRQMLFRTIRSLDITVILVTLHTSFEWLHDADSNDQADHPPCQDHKPNDATDVDADDRAAAALELIEEEERARGAVKSDVLAFYTLNAGGVIEVVKLACMAIFLTVSKVMGSYWFVWWIDDQLGLRQGQYLGGYLGLTLATCVFTSFLSIFLVRCTMRASREIHSSIVDSLLTAPISYFQRQPTGRILNRLSSDIEALDTKIINAVDAVIGTATTLFASLCLIALSSPIVVVAIIPYILMTTFYQSRFRIASREVQRSSSILQSPVTAIVSEALNAPASIKAYGAIMFMVSKHGAALDHLMSAKIVRKSLDTWITLRAELAANILLLVVVMLTVAGYITDVLGGLALTFATGLANDVFLMTWGLTDLEVQMNSIERLQEYHDNLPKEGQVRGLLVESTPVPKDWPRESEIDIKNMSLFYPSRPTPAVDNLTLHIQSGERLGVVGRTGSGKSTLVSSIARLVDPTSGSIAINGVETASISTQRLRLAVHTLPQEPLIFEGNVRENLDPRGQHTDEEILNVLDQCGLKSTLAENSSTATILSKNLTTGGTDLSAGQRQLLCAARVLLERPPILLVDEAAANIDYETDEALQKALHTMLPESTTMMTIAHRAASLAWLDRIIVMETGKIVEEGTPAELLENEGSYYYKAVRTEGERALQAALVVARTRQDRG
ncbi:P-loop containing nucleoside triphosphate hydrolase protein [Cryphonectria parasitica EP155]|uniref:P-loop containing nucleoside triphosphate hydrolase protein n=1 Tax=Cryphonectria parasitica (strain ATCC 38755 / EP155) TaxID=660469 RepID=A0A9P5CR91_CRYP1|nr:P-loop containing nucleoside triphosphate hydrolase protein [Cryphonectria parasitica EP155]KAF3767031.1 P-loop containing nucleoside triphosphate hydrolase protein [Cryphonectria parasitica EP155]